MEHLSGKLGKYAGDGELRRLVGPTCSQIFIKHSHAGSTGGS